MAVLTPITAEDVNEWTKNLCEILRKHAPSEERTLGKLISKCEMHLSKRVVGKLRFFNRLRTKVAHDKGFTADMLPADFAKVYREIMLELTGEPVRSALRSTTPKPQPQGFHKHLFTARMLKELQMNAERGDAQAQYKLGTQLAEMNECVCAYAWLRLAAESSAEAKTHCDEMERRMTREQVAAGEGHSDELRAQIAAKLKSGDK